MAKPKPKSPEEMSYEEAFQELKGLVEQLEVGDLPLEESLNLFERGQALSARCSNLLEEAELKLRQLTEDSSGGYAEEDLEEDIE